ncbi:MAG TPA: ABC transporter permease [Burkholderiales bacterium]|nr:ABC transporter permease [Burkholderiales bacterium]
MPYLPVLALKSAWNRRYTLSLILVSVALSTLLLLGVDRARTSARESFAQTVSATDLIVGARTSAVQLLLYSVFRLGDATSNVSWKSYQAIAGHPEVAWTIPISLGDSHRGYPLLGTTPDYFEFFRYGARQPLQFAQGRRFEGLFEAVAGAHVAKELGYRIGDRLILDHGTSGAGPANHSDRPFTLVGILAGTGTPVDRTVHVSLAAIEAIHLNWSGGAPMPGVSIPEQYVTRFDLTPKAITAAFVGLKSRAAAFRVQRYVNEFKAEPLMAALPGVALDQLWSIMSVAEQSLLFTAAMVVAASLAGLVAVLLAGLGERRRELAILRSVGAGPGQILLLILGESLLVTLAACLAGLLVLDLLTWAGGPWIQSRYGLTLSSDLVSANELLLLAAILAAAAIASTIPALKAYRQTLVDGLTPRI